MKGALEKIRGEYTPKEINVKVGTRFTVSDKHPTLIGSNPKEGQNTKNLKGDKDFANLEGCNFLPESFIAIAFDESGNPYVSKLTRQGVVFIMNLADREKTGIRKVETDTPDYLEENEIVVLANNSDGSVAFLSQTNKSRDELRLDTRESAPSLYTGYLNSFTTPFLKPEN